jgi:hypothetical protein
MFFSDGRSAGQKSREYDMLNVLLLVLYTALGVKAHGSLYYVAAARHSPLSLSECMLCR